MGMKHLFVSRSGFAESWCGVLGIAGETAEMFGPNSYSREMIELLSRFTLLPGLSFISERTFDLL